MATERIHLAEAVRDAEKYFDVPLTDLLAVLRRERKAEFEGEVEVADDVAGDNPTLPVKLKASGTERIRTTWDIALVFQGVRIDGVGWEEMYSDAQGVKREGWHRHVWDATNQHARRKVPETDLDRAASLEQFVIWSFSKLNVRLSDGIYGGDDLDL